MKAILYIGHGTRSKKGADEARAFIARVSERVDVTIQEISFLELTEPSIQEGFRRCVERGAAEVTVVPLFLLAAGHIKQDIPNVLEDLSVEYPNVLIDVKDPFGVQGKILDAVAELARETVGTVELEDRVLIVGRGSSDPATLADFGLIADGVKERLGITGVSVCYLAAAEPRFLEGLAAVMDDAEGKVIVIPYLLFSGLLIAEVTAEIRKWTKLGREIYHTGILSEHRVIEDIVVERATEGS
ncbi:sirohydrochlorin chelatase [Neobacillus drentensis]|uniref:sirohydrochlorin chelatase n=1 Tax=Neobacillus drentensis TaxID=220684 RepID=UPI001F322A97|nr:sirohydrochlorin chelatase [Neobacillus drentensis]ULT59225.1 sirohydrochlorin chelatase [Neobacillus drentensis]